jgi:hypothetical protein
MYIYLAYQDPKSTHSAYYLRKALVVAPDHATAMDLVARTITDVHPHLSGPLYVSPLGVCEEKRQPGLLGGPIWLETTSGGTAESRGETPTLQPGAQNSSAEPHADAGRKIPSEGSH